MADAVVHHPAPEVSAFEPPFLGAYSKKLGMWLFILSDALTFGALVFAYSYQRLATPGWPTPFDAHSIMNASVMTAFLLTSSLTMVLGVLAGNRGDHRKAVLWILATMACGAAFVVLHAMEWHGLMVNEDMWFNSNPWGPPQFGGTFYTLTGLHMLHVTLGVLYLGIIAIRKWALALSFVPWVAVYMITGSPLAHLFALLPITGALVLWGLQHYRFTAHDIETAGLYWHFVDLVWMFIFPMVYLMSTKV